MKNKTSKKGYEMKDLTGQQFGKLTVLYKTREGNSHNTRWFCQCDCGRTKEVQQHCLVFGKTKSCNCLKGLANQTTRLLKDHSLVGQIFGRLIVLSFYELKNGRSRWLCQCSCGNTIIVTRPNLKSGQTKSCGCLRKELLSQRSQDLTSTVSLEVSPCQTCLKEPSCQKECEKFEVYSNQKISTRRRYKSLKIENKY